MSDKAERIRLRLLPRAEAWLHRNSAPRLHMFLIVGATGACGFLFSFLMLKAGVGAMGVRYPLAVAQSYFVFLLLLRLWLGWQIPEESSDTLGSAADVVSEFTNVAIPIGPSDVADGPGTGDAVGALDLGEIFFAIVAALALSAGALVCAYVVWSGPALLAEVLVDGVVMSRVYARMKVADRSDWAASALRRTWLPALLVVLFFAVAGFAMQQVDPDAKSIGHVVGYVLGRMQ